MCKYEMITMILVHVLLIVELIENYFRRQKLDEYYAKIESIEKEIKKANRYNG